MDSSSHLETIIQKKYGAANLQAVFTDIEKYSMRKSTAQKDVIEAFTNLTKKSLHTLGQQYLDYTQEHNINFANDIIRIPTGDGLAIVFSFEGLQQIHLDFAKALLFVIHEKNIATPCETFEKEGWCNCHDNFRVRIGISEGKGIVYKDVNGSYNVAGATINVAARIMNLADGMQILLSDLAYHNLIDMTTDTKLEEKFRVFKDLQVKHGVKLDIYQYSPRDEAFVNSLEPSRIALMIKMRELQEEMGAHLLPSPDQIRELNDEAKLKFFEAWVALIDQMKKLFQEVKPLHE